MKYLFTSLIALILVLVSCQKDNPVNTIQGKTSLNEFLNIKLTGTWKIEGSSYGELFWKFVKWIPDSTEDSLYFFRFGYGTDSLLTLAQWGDFGQGNKNFYANHFENDSFSMKGMFEIKIKFIANNQFIGKHSGIPNDISGTLIE